MSLKDASYSSTRRVMLLGVGFAGFAGTLTACGSSNSGDSGSMDSPSSAPSSDTGNSGKGTAGQVLGSTMGIPVGGGKIFKKEKVVVTQPTAGEFKAFSAICTHQGCTVDKISGGKIHCPCHGSAFNVSDGSVAGGPAPAPLPSKTVTLKGDKITLA